MFKRSFQPTVVLRLNQSLQAIKVIVTAAYFFGDFKSGIEVNLNGKNKFSNRISQKIIVINQALIRLLIAILSLLYIPQHFPRP